MPVDNNNIEFILRYACNGCNLWRAKKGLPKFYFRQPLGNPTYSSPNLATIEEPVWSGYPIHHCNFPQTMHSQLIYL